MMEAYGKSTRDETLGNSSFAEAWGRQGEGRMSFGDRWDREVEARADYRPKGKVFSEQVWRAITDFDEITPKIIRHVMCARQLIISRIWFHQYALEIHLYRLRIRLPFAVCHDTQSGASVSMTRAYACAAAHH